MPPLRDRRGDIAAIARVLLKQLAHQVGPRHLSSPALARLAAHDWPGNVRELRNVLCRAADATPRDGRIDVREIDASLVRAAPPRVNGLTRAAALALLRQHGGNLSAAARAANVPRTSFRKLLGT